MLRSLAEYVNAADDGGLRNLCPQDIALCKLWRRLHADEAGAFPLLRERLRAWCFHHPTVTDEYGGRRREYLLRDQIARLEKMGVDRMEPEVVSFLCEVYNLTEGNGAGVNRAAERLEPHIKELRARAEAFPPVSLDYLDARATYLTPADLERAPMREIRVLAGIELPFRGRVFEFSGHVRVLGDVPENCTVVARDGHCAIDGYLLGRALSRYNLEVAENISGVAITLMGEIRARSIINNALVVAKLGSVHCAGAQGPKLIFAGKNLRVEGETLLGSYTARDFYVRERVRGGLVQISEKAECARFGHYGERSLSIVLRRELTCADYGEVPGPDLRKLLSEAYRLRMRAEQCEVNAAFAAEKAEQLAGSALMYLFGGGEAQKQLEDLAGQHRRLAAVRRVERNMRLVLDAAVGRLAEMDARATQPAGRDAPDDGFYAFDEEEAQEADLAEVNAHTLEMHARIRDAKLLRTQALATINEARGRLADLAEERAALEAHIAQASGSVGRIEQLEKLLGGEREQKRLAVLKRLLPRLREQPFSGAAQRLQEPFAMMTMRKINRALEQTKDYTVRAKAFREDFQTVNARLGHDFQVEVVESADESHRATRVVGCFEPGVEICMDYALESDHHAIPGAILTTPEGADTERRAYYRTHDGVQQHRQE